MGKDEPLPLAFSSGQFLTIVFSSPPRWPFDPSRLRSRVDPYTLRV